VCCILEGSCLLASYLLPLSYYSHSHEGSSFEARLLLKSFAIIAFRDLHIHPRTIAYIPRSSKQTCSMARSRKGLVRGIGSRAGKQRFADRVRMGDLGRMGDGGGGDACLHVFLALAGYAMLVLDITLLPRKDKRRSRTTKHHNETEHRTLLGRRRDYLAGSGSSAASTEVHHARQPYIITCHASSTELPSGVPLNSEDDVCNYVRVQLTTGGPQVRMFRRKKQ
jgi:hypothetical protein